MSKILVVDDEVDVRQILCRRMKAAGYETVEAGNGVAAVDLARSEKPDLILLDIMMPVQDGLVTYGVLREDASTKDIPVIFITGLSSDEQPVTLGRLGQGAKYLVFGKPYDPDELLAAISRMLE